MKSKITAGYLLLATLGAPLSSACFVPYGRHYYYPAVYSPWAGAAIVGAAVVGAAAMAAAEDAARYRAENCQSRTWYGGRWVYYCGDRWAYYEGRSLVLLPSLAAPGRGAAAAGLPRPERSASGRGARAFRSAAAPARFSAAAAPAMRRRPALSSSRP